MMHYPNIHTEDTTIFETPNHAEHGDSFSLSTESNMSEEALSQDQHGQESDEPISSVSEEVQMPQENSETDGHVTADTQSSDTTVNEVIQEYLDEFNEYFQMEMPNTVIDFVPDQKLFRITKVINNFPERTFYPFIAVIGKELLSDDKPRATTKKGCAIILITAADFKMHTINIAAGESFSIKEITAKVRSQIHGYGCFTSKMIENMVHLAQRVSELQIHKAIVEHIYNSEGLSLDNTTFVYKSTPIDTKQKISLSDDVKNESRYIVEDLLSCSNEPAALLLLIILQLISLLYEVFLKSDSKQKLALIPTFLTFIYGESGAGKTTISKAIFQATNSDRYVNVPNSTSASMQNALTEANSGVVLYDDIPHAGYDKCSSENKDKLELLIRSVGDMGAERRTARKSNSRPFSKRAMTAVTSEAPFFISESSTLRCLFINIKKGSIDLEKFGKYRNSGQHLDTVNKTFIRWAFSELLVFNANGFSVKEYDNMYAKAYEKAEDFSKKVEPRAFNNFLQVLVYFEIVTRFLTVLGFTAERIAEMESNLKALLKESALTQQEMIKCHSPEQAVLCAISYIISSNCVLSYKRIENRMTRISTESSGKPEGNVLGYYDNRYLILTSSQRKDFQRIFESFYAETIRPNAFVDLLYNMGLVVKPFDASVLLSRPNARTKIHIDNTEKDVIILKFPQGGKKDV